MDFDDPPMFKNCVHSHSKPSMPDWVFRRCKKRTISQAPLHHTDVQTLTIKYMMAYLKERRLLDPLPSSWKFEEPPVQLENLIEIQKDSIHFYDGDSAEVFLSHQDNPQLLALATHENAIRIRMKNHDAPESKFAVRIYKQAEASTTMQTFITRHIGLESLRAIRKIAFEAQHIYLEDQPTILTDRYNRRLMNIFVEAQAGSMQNISELLASQGHTLSYYTTGINTAINDSMRDAINNQRGIFSLPQDVFTYPYRPWELRKLWPDVSILEPPFLEYREILNPPKNPGRAWRLPSEHNDNDEGDENESQQSDSFFFRVVPSEMIYESLCFKAPSTIPNAGYGLFLRPHGVIPKGSHLCLYSARSTTEAEMDAAMSTRDYALRTGKDGLWFDAELDDGNNFARFSNQANVAELLQNVKELSQKDKRPAFEESDWKEIEEKATEMCNVKYKVVARKLILCNTKELPRTRTP